MADICHYPYDSLISSINLDDSDSSWITSLSLFCTANADAFSLPTERKDYFLGLLRQKLHINVHNETECNFELCLQLCDCARIAERDKLDIDQLICEEFMADVFLIVKHPHSGASVMALRSLINLMNEHVASYKIFTGEPLNGINELITLLRLLIHDNREPQIIFLSTKLMYMLQSQRAVTAGPLLRASDSESCFFLQLGRCLSPGPYEYLVLELDKRKQNTDEIVARLGHENTPDVACEVQPSDTADCAIEDVASLSDARIDQIDLTFDSVPSVTVSTADTRGFVRDGWGPLFIETCKLLYTIYGEECYIGEDNAAAAPDLALLSDVLTDIILVPLFADSTDTPPGFADIFTQRSCRRYALQLAMLSLDQEHTTHENRIIENIIARSGIQILCTLLNECFSELEKAAENDETNIMQGTACISNSSSAVLLYPILSLLLKVSTFSEAATADLKLLIFPNPWKTDTRANENDQEEGDVEEEEGDEMGPDYLQRKMDPTDIPTGTLRARLVGSMISLDSLLKRYCAELLYALCDKNTGEFVSRTGFGNAIALMQIKGLI